METKERFDTIAREYNTIRETEYGFSGTPDYFEWVRARYIQELFSTRPLKILEAGSGQSSLKYTLTGAALLISVDLSFEMLRRNPNTGKLVNANLARTAFKNSRFDAVILINVLHHIDRKQYPAVFAELNRILTPGGRVVVFEHNPYNPVTRYIVSNCSFDQGCELVSPGMLTRQAADSGFTVEKKAFILYFPKSLRALFLFERYLNGLPFGGQYYLAFKK